MFRSVVYHRSSLIGEVEIHPKNSNLGTWTREIRISYISHPPSDRCSPLAILHTISTSGVCFMMESKRSADESLLFSVYSACLRENKASKLCPYLKSDFEADFSSFENHSSKDSVVGFESLLIKRLKEHTNEEIETITLGKMRLSVSEVDGDHAKNYSSPSIPHSEVGRYRTRAPQRIPHSQTKVVSTWSHDLGAKRLAVLRSSEACRYGLWKGTKHTFETRERGDSSLAWGTHGGCVKQATWDTILGQENVE
ncbi:hypothetical protein KSP40_PGU019111 [Platanthera guangdongensis]|uniref:Uncharacterized protein n=1 Tax=Platanthera guangdongensis TaxID=2320717 RepID=A0ABR2LNC5_9ASPA